MDSKCLSVNKHTDESITTDTGRVHPQNRKKNRHRPPNRWWSNPGASKTNTRPPKSPGGSTPSQALSFLPSCFLRGRRGKQSTSLPKPCCFNKDCPLKITHVKCYFTYLVLSVHIGSLSPHSQSTNVDVRMCVVFYNQYHQTKRD